ncbi:hypothetical protein [Agromyces protaetiae]|uniref:hypothetical protein n=1 Tax=Agromyces protaetiae TaxID=2509455 RepID=UPI001FB64029|nr:hypothetical protein [Agromyces protaetiae]
MTGKRVRADRPAEPLGSGYAFEIKAARSEQLDNRPPICGHIVRAQHGRPEIIRPLRERKVMQVDGLHTMWAAKWKAVELRVRCENFRQEALGELMS